MKRYVACRNNTFRMKDVQKLTHEAIQSITVDAWESCTNHVLSIKNRLCEAEGIVEAIQPVIISFSSDESSEESDSFSFSSDDSSEESD